MARDKEDQNTTGSMDLTSPLYMHPSESARTTLVPVVFDGTGHRSWRRGVLRALSVKNKVGFINGKCKKPKIDEVTYDQWARCDDMVTSWILNSLSEDLADSLQYVNDAKELWQELEDRYDQTNGAKLYQLQKEINDLSQGTLDITGYYTKMKRLWEELNTLNAHAQCNCQCICGAKANMQKAEQDHKLIQFLMGLNEVYTVVRGIILMMNPLPNIAQDFSILIQEEKQRERGGNTGENSYNSNKSGYPSARTRMFCDYCKRPGHTRDICYRIHGFPQDFKFTKGRNVASAANVHVDSEEMEGGNQSQGLQSLTKEQYNQLLNLLEKFPGRNT
ncbi:PREDICTED: uncharacterized protein LOC109243507 [Nicotiana attenuata]|uniref:uncharacterized protein LOC109243507 n=1 Tax=Nicotiana attenuata TaxID=49451 RepID=UPI00090589B4|nr:PREDICTED: uncharacterized protein LOC109243507 [Nicotiana attenuata]